MPKPDLDRTIDISDEQVRFYQANGYIQFDDVLTPEELEQAREDLTFATEGRRAAIDRGENLTRYRELFDQMVNLWTDFEGIRRLTLSRRLGEIARRLIGAERVRLWHDHSLVKGPRTDTPSPWHQDWVYWPMNQVGAMSCWLALDDVDENNGCLSFVPRTHSWGPYPPISLTNPEPLFEMVEEEHEQDLKPVCMKMRAGSCTFHDGLTFHYAPGNKTDAPRRAMAIIYMPDGTTYRKKNHCVTDPLGLEDGALLNGEMFPVLGEGEAFATTTFKEARPMMHRLAVAVG